MEKLLKKIGLGSFVTPPTQSISTSEAIRKLDDENCIMIDVRNVNEWQSSGVPKRCHLVSLQDEDFVAKIVTLADGEKSSPIILTCLSGARAQKASTLLQKVGFENLYCIKGGIADWANSGHVSPYQDEQ